MVASDSQGLTLAGFAVIDTQTDSVLAADTAQLDSVTADTSTFTFDPAGLQPTLLRFIGFAMDGDSAEVTDTVDVNLRDTKAPVVQILDPANGQQIPLYDTLAVQVLFADSQAGLSQIQVTGVALRGDSAQATDTIITRFETQTRAYSSPWTQATTVDFRLPPVNDNTESVLIIAQATDASGNVGADTVSITVGGPWIAVLAPDNGDSVSVGSSVNVEVAAVDRGGLSDVWMDIISGTDTTTSRLCCASPNTDTVRYTQTVVMPSSAGPVTVAARAKNATSNIVARNSVTLTVVSTAVVDTVAPTATIDWVTADRMELTDTMAVVVTGKDPGGIDSLAVTIVGLNTATPDTLVYDSTIVFPATLGGTVRGTFLFDLRTMYARIAALLPDTVTLPDTIAFQAYGFAYDADGNCGAAAFGAPSGVVPSCGTRTIGGSVRRIATGTAQPNTNVTAVRGLTVMLPTPGVIADAVVDTTTNRERLYLSNMTNNSVEALNLDPNPANNQFLPQPVLVGSQPWGLFLDNSGDTLIVANSGGTNVSMVALNTGTPTEAQNARILTPNAVFYQISVAGGGTDPYTYSGTYLDFSDRPQFVAQDSTGRILYSTVPTSAAKEGTIRFVDRNPDHNVATTDDPEIHVLFNDKAVKAGDDKQHAIANVDSLVLLATGETNNFSDYIRIYGHVPGDRTNYIVSIDTTIDAAVADYNAKMFAAATTLGIPGNAPLYYAFHMRGTWDPTQFAMSDTTFVAASGDRGVIAFGEGATAPTGRIILYNAASGGRTDGTNETDLVNNAAERVLGVGLNYNGSLGVARGVQGAYFFSGYTPEADPLRLQGLYTEGMDQGGAGATMHPRHTDFRASNDSTLAFVGGDHQIKVIDTFHFFDVADLDIRDTVVGPLRSSLPLPDDNLALTNAGLSCARPNPAPACIVVKLYGVTNAGGVVIVNVRQRDITP